MSDNTPEAGEPPRDSDLFGELGGSSDDVVAPTGEAGGGNEPAAAPEPQPPAAMPAEPAVASAKAVPPSEPASTGSGAGDKPYKRARWPFVALGLIVTFLVVVGWTKTVNSTSFCTRCHSMQASADTAAHSVHANVSCIACHHGPGIQGAITYIPTFVRELADQLTPLSVAQGVMDPAPCSACHQTVFTSALLKGEHPSTGCDECHGNTTHPTPVVEALSATDPHPSTWVQLHGRAANEDPQSCETCHPPQSCMSTCHFKLGGSFPHPKNWIPIHGQVQLRQGADACTLCHAPTFCASCHGTEIPHASDWLQEHPVTVTQKQNSAQCLICHVQTDCTYCHIRHGVHPEQSLYSGWSKP